MNLTLIKYALIPVIPIVVYLHFSALLKLHSQDVNDQIVQCFVPYESVSSPVLPFEQHKHGKSILLVLQEIVTQHIILVAPLKLYYSTYLLCFIQLQPENLIKYFPLPLIQHRGPPVFA